ncbi:MAG: hypothetical protein D6793_11915 [Thermoflexia bacterium]|nr:MAG: hypothetical protein D6793_11915 [Thermoflexia bacterium]
MLPEDKRRQIQQIFENFLRERARAIRRLRIEDLDVNPFLIRLLSKELGLQDARSIVRWLVNQRLERGTVTSFGLALQKAAQVFSEGTGVEGADILKTREGRHYYIQREKRPESHPQRAGETDRRPVALRPATKSGLRCPLRDVLREPGPGLQYRPEVCG